MFVRGIDFPSVSTIFRLNVEAIPTVLFFVMLLPVKSLIVYRQIESYFYSALIGCSMLH